MIRNIIYVLALLVMFSCIQSPKTIVKDQNKEFLLKQYLDSFLIKNGNCLNNDLTEKECTHNLKKEFISKNLGDSIKCISELPLEFDMLMEYNNDKFVVKFAFGEFSSNCKLSEDYEVTFQAFAVVDKKSASELKEGKLYNIKGSCYEFADAKSFILPSGKYFEDFPQISKSDNKPYFNLGTLIIKNLSFKEIVNNQLDSLK